MLPVSRPLGELVSLSWRTMRHLIARPALLRLSRRWNNGLRPSPHSTPHLRAARAGKITVERDVLDD